MPVLKLTAAAIPTLKPKADGRREVYRDSVTQGLLLEVHASGRRTFYAWGHVRGGRAWRLQLGRWAPGVYELAQAREDARQALALGRTEDPSAAKRRAKAAGTFGDLAETFLTEAQIRESTREEWRLLLKHSRLAQLRKAKTTEVTRGDLVRLFDRIRAASIKAGGKGYAANRTLEAVRRVFNWAVQRDLIPASPCVGVIKPTKEQPRQRAYTDAELGAIVRALDESATSDAVRVALYTGVRIEQALGAPWTEVDLDKKEWLIAGDRTGTKNSLPHLVPLVVEAKEVFERRANDTPYVFPTSKGGTLWRSQRAIEGIGERSGVADFRPHDLRRTLNTWLASLAGGAVPQPVRDAILGHKPPGLEAVYNVHGYAKEKRTALERWARHVERCAAAKPGKVLSMPAAGA
jgi:integrase